MKVTQLRLLRGANLFATVPCLMALVDLGDMATIAPARLRDARGILRTLLPGLNAPVDATVEQLLVAASVELQALAGGVRGYASASHAHADTRRIVFAYQIEHVAQAALSHAMHILTDLLNHVTPDLDGALAQLRARTANYQLAVRAQAVAEAARTRALPVTRVSEHAGLLQIGWGSRQQRYLDGASEGQPLLGRAIAADRQLTRALLEESGISVPRGGAVDNLADACRVAQRIGYPVALWPAHATAGDSLPTSCAGEAELTATVHDGERWIVERVMAGPVRQVTVIGARASECAGLSPALRLLAERAASKIGLPDAVVQIALPEIAGGAAAVLGLRALARAPGLESESRRRDGAAGAGRIPVIAITGTNGKTTTTLMIEHVARLAGMRTGCTTTQGVFLHGVQTMRGDCTGYWSHRAVLSEPEVDIAVLETARGGILKRGLAFDACDVGVLLNVSDDHLGLDGVDTVADLARVKGLVVQAARGAAVLNADDPHCVAQAETRHPGTQLVWFSMQSDNPVVRAHVGSAVVLRDESIKCCATAAPRS